ncbi:MAG: type II secretion system protein GspG [Planctomycetota bacterium]
MSRRTPHTRRARTGFTIIEVMVVLVILGLIGGIVTLNLVGAAGQAKVSTTKQSMQQVVSALNMYHTQHSSYPATANWEQAIQNTLQKAPEDGWGNKFEYFQTESGQAFQLFSAGEDGVSETDDDISIGPTGEAQGPA